MSRYRLQVRIALDLARDWHAPRCQPRLVSLNITGDVGHRGLLRPPRIIWFVAAVHEQAHGSVGEPQALWGKEVRHVSPDEMCQTCCLAHGSPCRQRQLLESLIPLSLGHFDFAEQCIRYEDEQSI